MLPTHMKENENRRAPSAGMLCASIIAFFLLWIAAPVKAGSRPNILVITSDDLGLQVGCYGDPNARTPNVDQLGRQGVRFDTAWVAQSSCSPSRASILTGSYPHQNGQVGLENRGFNAKTGIALLPNVLRQAGYFTGVIGKLHVGPESAFALDFRRSERVKNRNLTQLITLGADAAAEFFEQAGDRPFFLKYSFTDPHLPFRNQVEGAPSSPLAVGDVPLLPWIRSKSGEAAESDEGEGADKGDAVSEKSMAGFYNGIARMDEGLGLLLARLRESGKLDNTLIFFLGDNGAPFPGGKATCYEPGLRVPFIVSWPAGGIEKGVVSPEMVSTVDIFPTAVEAAGLPPQPDLPGRSLLPVLRGQSSQPPAYLFAEFNFHSHRSYRPARTVRDDRFQLIHNLSASPVWELYDLKADPCQRTNLADDAGHAADLVRLQEALLNWRRQTNDPLLDPAKIEEWRQAVASSLGKKAVTPPVSLVQ